MIVPELQFFEIQREVSHGDPMMFDESLIGPTPESLQAVDVDLARGEDLLVIDLQVPIPAKHQAVVTCESVRIEDAASTNLFDGQLQQGGRRDIGDNRDVNPALALENAEYGHFPGRPTTSVAFASAAEVGLVEFDFTTQEGILGMTQDRRANRTDGPIDGPVR